jgi:hypothetical protein
MQNFEVKLRKNISRNMPVISWSNYSGMSYVDEGEW